MSIMSELTQEEVELSEINKKGCQIVAYYTKFIYTDTPAKVGPPCSDVHWSCSNEQP